MAIASRGIPIASITICMPDIEAEGIHGAPMDATIAIRKTVTIMTFESSMP